MNCSACNSFRRSPEQGGTSQDLWGPPFTGMSCSSLLSLMLLPLHPAVQPHWATQFLFSALILFIIIIILKGKYE